MILKYTHERNLVYRNTTSNPILICSCSNNREAARCAKTLNAEADLSRRYRANIVGIDWPLICWRLESENKRIRRLLDEHGNPREIARTEQLAAIHRKHSIYKSEVARLNESSRLKSLAIRDLEAQVEDLLSQLEAVKKG